jgi:hypothetical protein
LTIFQPRVTLAAVLPAHCGQQLFGGAIAVGSFVSRQDAALAAGVTLHVVKSWVHRGWQADDGVQRKVRTQGLDVDLDDVLAAERDTRRKTQRSHRRIAA